MSRLDKETIVNKQSRFKYDTKNRKQKEKRNERITLRCTESVKEKFESICQKSGKSQGDIFEEMLNKNKVIVIPYAKEASEQLCEVHYELAELRIFLQSQDISGVEEYIKKQTEMVENISSDLCHNLNKEGF